MGLLAFTTKRAAAVILAQAAAQHLMDRDEHGTSRLHRWTAAARGITTHTCTVCGRDQITAEARTCHEHNLIYTGIVSVTHHLGLPDTVVEYRRARHARTYEAITAGIAQIMCGPGVLDTHACPSITSTPEIPRRCTFVPDQILVGRTPADYQIITPAHALHQRIVSAIHVPGAAPITSADDPRIH